MEWSPAVDLKGNRSIIAISATDASNESECGLFLAAKVRPKVYASTWRKSWPDDKDIFPLGDVVNLARAAHRNDETTTHKGLTEFLDRRFDEMDTNRGVRPYLRTAVENYLDVHEGIAREIGPLRMVTDKPAFAVKEKSMNVWAPTYDTASGTREVRRLRFGSAHSSASESDQIWAATAAFVAAKAFSSNELTRIRVVEVGLSDGSSAVIFDGSPQDAFDNYKQQARDRAANLTKQYYAQPCRSCGDCKIAGACSELPHLHGMFGTDRRGYKTRSVAPSDLEYYDRCPLQWLLTKSLHLPQEQSDTAQQSRGLAAHNWLKTGHASKRPCSDLDLNVIPEPGYGQKAIAEEAYKIARSFVEQHVSNCPLERDGVEVIAVEQDTYGYDPVADVIPACRPDLVYRDGNKLIIREFKTVGEIPKGDRDAIQEKFIQIPFLLSMLSSGLTKKYGADIGVVELELLTAEESKIFSWSTNDPIDLPVAKADLRRVFEEWHVDNTWTPSPGPYCGWCPVRNWCPDSRVWEENHPAGSSSSLPEIDLPELDDDPAPF